MRIAIVGAGPSGFFLAGELLKRCPAAAVVMFEQRVAPYGLVRYGVAPDHTATRRVIRTLDQIADHPRFHYLGNITVGRDVTWAELHASHHAVVACTGADQPRRPEVPGAALPGVLDALTLSRWANGEPESFPQAWLEGVPSVVIVGNGNVALDIVRLFARAPEDWTSTDLPPYAHDVLSRNPVGRIVVVGRRSPQQASFTEAELEEVITLPNWQVQTSAPLPFSLVPSGPDSSRVLEFHFNWQTACLLGSHRVEGIRFSRPASGETMERHTPLVIFATGHRATPIPGLPYDAKQGVIPSRHGAVPGAGGYYVCGWVKRGAQGLIGHNRKDAVETAGRIMEDLDLLRARHVEPVAWAQVLLKRGCRPVNWPDWERLNLIEREQGHQAGRLRINLTRQQALGYLHDATGS